MYTPVDQSSRFASMQYIDIDDDMTEFNEDYAANQAAVREMHSVLELASVGARHRFAVAELPIVAATTAQDTSIVLPAGKLVLRTLLKVVTAEATGTTKTIDFGIKGGDEDGFLDGVSVAATGIKQGSLAYNAVTLGALLRENTGNAVNPVPIPYLTTASTTFVYALGSNDFAELKAYAIVEYLEFASDFTVFDEPEAEE